MKTIHRFEVPLDGQVHEFELNAGTAGSPVAVANGQWGHGIEFWAVVDNEHHTTARRFTIVGTGHELPKGAAYVGTAPRTHDGFVWHLVEV